MFFIIAFERERWRARKSEREKQREGEREKVGKRGGRNKEEEEKVI